MSFNMVKADGWLWLQDVLNGLEDVPARIETVIGKGWSLAFSESVDSID